jgi:hypothetical protein
MEELAVLANDWNGLSKTEQKSRLETAIGETIDRLASFPSPPTQWQKAKVLAAIDATTRGLFDLAATHLSQVFAEIPIGRPLSHPDTNLADFDEVGLMTLRDELERLKARPVQDPPDFL